MKLPLPDLADTLIALGGVLVVIGVGCVLHWAAAVLVAGLELILVGLVLTRRV